MSCFDPWFTYFYKRCKSRIKKRSDLYNWLTRRYKRRNRHPRYKCKKHKDFCALLTPTGSVFDWDNWERFSHRYFLQITKELGATEYDYG